MNKKRETYEIKRKNRIKKDEQKTKQSNRNTKEKL